MTFLIFIYRALAIIYPIFGLAFYFGEATLGSFLGFDHSNHAFWKSLTVSMMFMLGYTAWRTARTVEKGVRDKSWFIIHLISKATSVFFFAVSFVRSPHVFYLVGAGVDSLVFVFVLFSLGYYLKVRSRLDMRQN